jgi:hypothetical protein
MYRSFPVKKSLKLSFGSVVAGALGAILLPASSASATEGFVCPTGTDTIEVPYAYAADGTALLAGTVCVNAGTTVFNSVDVSDGWSAEVKSDGTNSNQATEVRFTEPSTGDRIELKYEPGRTEIK